MRIVLFYGENLKTDGLKSKVLPTLKPGKGRSLLGNVHVHIKKTNISPSPDDVFVLSKILALNPKFGNFIMVIGESEYVALVVTDVKKAQQFYHNHSLEQLSDRLVKKNLKRGKENADDNRKKAIKTIKRFIKKSKRNGLRLYHTIDEGKTKFQRL